MEAVERENKWNAKVVLRKCVAVLTLLLCVLSCWAKDSDVLELRKLYYQSYKDKKAADKLYKETRAYDAKQPKMLGYKAVASMMMCNYITNPYTKVKYFYAGKGDLEKAIKVSPADVELRYLRYAVQENVPSVLNYSGSMNEDRRIIVAYLNDADNREKDPDLHARIMKYMLNSKTVPAETKTKISSG
jgi:hypothetical protein